MIYLPDYFALPYQNQLDLQRDFFVAIFKSLSYQVLRNLFHKVEYLNV